MSKKNKLYATTVSDNGECRIVFAKLNVTDKNQLFIKTRNRFYPRTLSFESVSYSNHFIRHKNRMLCVDANNGTDLFRKDSSFISFSKNKFNVAWLCPFPITGSGGIRTLLRFLTYCAKEHNQRVDVWIKIQPWEKCDRRVIVDTVYGEYVVKGAAIYTYTSTRQIPNIYHTIYCTNPYTAYDCNIMKLCSVCPLDIPFCIKYTNVGNKIMLIQDTEWISDFKASNVSVEWLKGAYKFDMSYISMGTYLRDVLIDEFNVSDKRIKTIDFYIDTTIYSMIDDSCRTNTVCILYQPEKNRRNPQLILDLIRTLLKLNIDFIVYGSNATIDFIPPEKNYGLVTPQECASLYNRCKVGYISQDSNPSRIPFEMYACGLNVVTSTSGPISMLKDVVNICDITDNNTESIIETIKRLMLLPTRDDNSIVKGFAAEERQVRTYVKKYITFDMFDTIVTRPCGDEDRDSAEQILKESGTEHITLVDLFNEDIKHIYKVGPLYNMMVENKGIIISDMYYTSNMLLNILFKVSPPSLLKWSPTIFVSSEHDKSKYHGLYDIVLQNMNILPDQLLHIGNDKKADVKATANNHISSVFIDVGFSQRDNLQKTTGSLYDYKTILMIMERINNLTMCPVNVFTHSSNISCNDYLVILRKLRLSGSGSSDMYNDTIHDVSSTIFTPFLVCFVDWCFKRAIDLGINKLVFLTRDGFILHRIATMIQYHRSEYSKVTILLRYSSRQTTNPYTLSKLTTMSELLECKWLMHRPEGKLTKNMILSRLWAQNIIPSVRDDNGAGDNISDKCAMEFVQYLHTNYWENIINNIESNEELYQYMNSYLNEPVILVDSGWHGNLIYNTRKIFKDNKNIYGLFITQYKFIKFHDTDINISWIDGLADIHTPVQQLCEVAVSHRSGVFINKKDKILSGPPEVGKTQWGLKVQYSTIVSSCNKLLGLIPNIDMQSLKFHVLKRFIMFANKPTRIESYVYGMFPYSSDQTDLHYKRLADEQVINHIPPIWRNAHICLNK